MTNPAPAPDLTPWEQAYRRFETPEEEVRKFMGRLRRAGAESWPRAAQVVELFCGRGNGLRALERLGFRNLEGVDLSAALAAEYSGPGKVIVGDCRQLPFPDNSRDILIVQGGLHHLPSLPEDLDRTLAEIARVLRPNGRFMAVEPWLTPFLRFVHALCGSKVVRRLSGKFDALAVMIEHEKQTYFQWLSQPESIRQAFDRQFACEQVSCRLGKIQFVGRKT